MPYVKTQPTHCLYLHAIGSLFKSNLIKEDRPPTSKLEIEVQKICRWEAPDRCRTVNHELRTSELMVSVSCAQLKHKRKLPHFKFLIPTICCHHSSFPLQLYDLGLAILLGNTKVRWCLQQVVDVHTQVLTAGGPVVLGLWERLYFTPMPIVLLC